MKKCSASALITALFIMALIAIAATAMSLRLQIDIRRTELSLNADKIYRTAEAVNRYALHQIAQKDFALNPKTARFPLTQLNQFQIQGDIQDLESKFNINLLQAAPRANTRGDSVHQVMTRLLMLVSPDLSSLQATALMRQISDMAPYSDVSEVRPFMSAVLYRRLKPFITALPEQSGINLNTARSEIIHILNPTITAEKANAFVAIRKRLGGFKSVADIYRNPDIRALKIALGSPIKTSLKSHFYLSRAVVQNDEQSIVLFDVIQKKKKKAVILREWRG